MALTGATREFPLAPLQRSAWITSVVISVAVAAVAVWAPRHAPPTSLRIALPAFIALLMLALGLALRRRRITIEGRELVIAATLYTKRFDIATLDLASARIVDLAERTEFAPMLKLGGYGLPGFKAGNFLLRDRKRAFCLLTDRNRVLVLPQRDGSLLLLSPERPQPLLDALNALVSTATKP